MPACSSNIFDIGPGAISVALQIITLATVYLTATRVQKAVEGQQAVAIAKTQANGGGK